jgi:putative hydrolase
MLKIDLHIHTVASLHAQSTIFEYVNRAKELGMETIGISEHGPLCKSSHADENYFVTLGRIPRNINGVNVLKGIEANVIDSEGNIDVTERMADGLEYVMCGFHVESGYDDQGLKGNTATIIKTIESGKIDIVTHPFFTVRFKTNVKKIAEAACANDVFLEVNKSYLKEYIIRQENTLENLKEMIKVVKKHGKKVIVNSDSHSIWELGDDSALEQMKDKIGLSDDMIINNYPEELFKLLKIKM